MLPCIQIAATVTSIGRSLIMKTKDIVESKFTRSHGLPCDAEVVYG